MTIPSNRGSMRPGLELFIVLHSLLMKIYDAMTTFLILPNAWI
jgi:hypothetical protein